MKTIKQTPSWGAVFDTHDVILGTSHEPHGLHERNKYDVLQGHMRPEVRQNHIVLSALISQVCFRPCVPVRSAHRTRIEFHCVFAYFLKGNPFVVDLRRDHEFSQSNRVPIPSLRWVFAIILLQSLYPWLPYFTKSNLDDMHHSTHVNSLSTWMMFAAAILAPPAKKMKVSISFHFMEVAS